MATYLENLTAARDGAAAQLASMYADVAVSYVPYTENGRTFMWGQKEAQLLKTIDALNERIAGAEPFEIVTYGYPG